MKQDSCRRCGQELEVDKKCDICSQVTQFHCHGCGNVTDEQIHFQCMMTNMSHTLLAN